MKGDRRQHMNEPLLAQQRYTKMVDDSATATRLFNKPINQSKCPGKCHNKGRCSASGHHHKHAVCKSRDKAKGAMKMKIRSIDPENEWTKYPVGNSATRVLAYLANQEGYNDNDYDYQDRVEETYAYDHDNDNDNDHDHDHDHDYATHAIDLFGGGFAIGIGIVIDEHENDVAIDNSEFDDDGIDHEDDEFDDDDDAMSFCDVGLCWGHEDGDEYGDDGWYLVGGQME